MSVFDTMRKIVAGRYVTPGATSAIGTGTYSYGRITKYGVMLTGGESFNETLFDDAPADNAAHSVAAYTDGARALCMYIYNATGQPVEAGIYLYNGVTQSMVYKETLAHATVRIVGPGAAGIGADAGYVAVPALAFPGFLVFGIYYKMPAGSASGNIRFIVGRMT